MKCNDFILAYWRHYVSLEKELLECLNYVELDVINFKTYSSHFSKLMLEICSEIDVIFKIYCKQLNPRFNRNSSIDRYRENIFNIKNSFIYETVNINNTDIKLEPWIKWNNNDKNPDWWKIYNSIKHERTSKVKINGLKMESYKFGNLESVLNALAGLYQILIYMYYELAISENKEITTPLPGSRIFRLSGNLGQELVFYQNEAFYIKESELICERGLFYY